MFVAIVFAIVLCIQSGQCMRCFECSSVSSPLMCTDIKICPDSETCYTEQVVTDLGEIVYNTGCINKLQCHNKKRANDSPATGITTCKHCCSGDYCNKDGCGVSEVPRDQRGPHCFTCDSHIDVNTCRNISTCNEDESCLIHVPNEFSHLLTPLYRSKCEPKHICPALELAEHEGPCPARCCDNDYCNDRCLYNDSTGPTQSCDTSNGYVGFAYGTQSMMCIKVHSERLDWVNAQFRCQREGASLIATQTAEKIAALKLYLTSSNLANYDYWIGLYDKAGSDVFFWVTGEQLTATDWGTKPLQPTHVYNGQNEDCVYMYHGEPFKWHDAWCSRLSGFICEKI